MEERMLECAEKKLLSEMVNRESKSTTVDTIDQSLGEKRKRKSRLVHIDVKGLGGGM